jgi:hypothetical protein
VSQSEPYETPRTRSRHRRRANGVGELRSRAFHETEEGRPSTDGDAVMSGAAQQGAGAICRAARRRSITPGQVRDLVEVVSRGHAREAWQLTDVEAAELLVKMETIGWRSK